MSGLCARLVLFLAVAAPAFAQQAPQPESDRGFLETISGARLQANSHYPTDLIMGAALGVLSGHAATFELGRRRVSLSPSVPAGGGLLIGGSIQ